MRRISSALLVLGALAAATPAWAQRALARESLRDYIRGRDDLPKPQRLAWEKAIMMRFGGAALDEDTTANVQITVAKAIISNAIFMESDPNRAAAAAFEGYRGALGYVPPPLAIRYQVLALEGRKFRGTPEQLTFNFPKYYDDELAPELVAYWEKGLKEGTFPDDIRGEIRDALEATRLKMRPLLAGKLRVLAQLALQRPRAEGEARDEIQRNIEELEEELVRSFRGVASRPEVLDRKRPPYERLKAHLAGMGAPLLPEDHMLDPARRETERPEPRPSVAREPERGEPETRAAEEEARREAKARAAEEEARREAKARAAEEEARREAERAVRADPRPGARLLLQPPPVAVTAADVEPALKGAIQPWLGTPYRWGSGEKGAGTDCSGFTKGVAEESFVIGLPRSSRDQYRTGWAVTKQAELLPGDLVFFDTSDLGRVNHVGFYAGNGKFAHASSSRGVIYDDLSKAYYQRAYRGARRIVSGR